VNRIALVARLKPGGEEQASVLLEHGLPFDPAERGFTRHAVYLSAGEWIVDEIVNELFGAGLSTPGRATRTSSGASQEDLAAGSPAIAWSVVKADRAAAASLADYSRRWSL
jgi:hypothetical protein